MNETYSALRDFSLAGIKGMEYKYVLQNILDVVKVKARGYLNKSVWIRAFSLCISQIIILENSS